MTVVGNSQFPVQTVERLKALLADVQGVRERSLWICEHLEIEDFGATDARCEPTSSILLTNWFFETFLIKRFFPAKPLFHPDFEHLFNSTITVSVSPTPG